MTCIRIKDPGHTYGMVCTLDYPRPDPESDCPNAAAHEPFPLGYVAASEHAEQLIEAGRTQEAPCPGCGRWTIWTPASATDRGEESA